MIRYCLLYIILLAATVTPRSASAQAAKANHYAFNIQQALDYAKANNVQVKNALLNVQAQKETNREITAAALPNIFGTGNVINNLNIPVTLLPGEITGQPAGTFVPVRFGTKYNSTVGIQLQQTLFDGQVFVGLQARKTSVDFQLKNVEVTEELIKANIYKVYYQLVASKTQIQILDANIQRLEKLENDTRILYNNGFAEKLDEDKVSIQLTNLNTEKVKALNSIEIGYLGLKTLLGMPAKDTLELTDKITEGQIEANILADTGFQYQDRKEYQYLELGKKLNEYNIKRYQLSYLPTLSMNAAYNKNAQRNTFDLFVKDGEWFTASFVAFNISIPIFSGFAKDAQVAKSKIDLRQTNNQLENLRNTIDNEVQQARINFNSAQNPLRFQKKNMELAEKVYNQTRKKYKSMTRRLIPSSDTLYHT
jgi:outer membrane protein TolC